MKKANLASPLISVVVPVYNAEKYITVCVESILSQTYSNVEVLLVNDGSRDGSAELCDQLAGAYSAVRVLHQENRGAAYARKVGLLEANGEYVAFVDADDWIEPTFFADLLAENLAQGADVIIGRLVGVRDDTRKSTPHYFPCGQYEKQALEKQIYPEMLSAEPFYTFGIFPSMCAKLFRRELARQCAETLASGISFGEDGCFTYSVILAAGSVSFVNAEGYCYRYNPSSASRNFREKTMEDAYLLRAFYRDLATQTGWQIGAQAKEYLAYVCRYIVATALRAPAFDKKALRRCLADNFPQGILKNEKIRKLSLRHRAEFWLLAHGWLRILRLLYR